MMLTKIWNIIQIEEGQCISDNLPVLQNFLDNIY